jgi:hypothetical protein
LEHEYYPYTVWSNQLITQHNRRMWSNYYSYRIYRCRLEAADHFWRSATTSTVGMPRVFFRSFRGNQNSVPLEYIYQITMELKRIKPFTLLTLARIWKRPSLFGFHTCPSTCFKKEHRSNPVRVVTFTPFTCISAMSN